MKRIASLLLAACLLAAPQLTGKAQAEGFALSDFGAHILLLSTYHNI